MSLAPGALVALILGILVLAVVGRRLALLLWVFWHEALMYFGLLPYPHEVVQRRRVGPTAPAGSADRTLHPDSG